MTYEELLEFLKVMESNDDNRIEDNVTVWSVEDGEYYQADLLQLEESDGILDEGHLFLSINH
jgi:hypothetical protein|tara:strand:- start:157 stop:342 length:186 start_codon:yes stop_codon:yes gene_type:complete